jgi:hypothetical protein
MPDAKTIIASGQVEHYKCAVNDKSAQITGRVPYIEMLEGYKVPLSTRNGLVYAELRPFTDTEWKELPHIVITSDCDWNPSVLDQDVPSDWYKEEPTDEEYPKESIHDEKGEYKPDTAQIEAQQAC